MLERIQAYFGGAGGIFQYDNNSIMYKITSLTDLNNVIIPHFSKYPLLTKKRADFVPALFKKVVGMINLSEHLTSDGLQQIVNLRAAMNKGLSEELKRSFPNTEPVSRPELELTVIPDPHWVTGIVEAEGCFYTKTHQINI